MEILETLKYETVANVGDFIKAWNFEPREGLPNDYIIAKVIEKVTDVDPENFTKLYKHYKVEVVTHIAGDNNITETVGEIFYVPFQTTRDYENRVTKI